MVDAQRIRNDRKIPARAGVLLWIARAMIMTMTMTNQVRSSVVARRAGWFILLPCLACLMRHQAYAVDEAPSPSSKIAERPWAMVWMSSLARTLANCDVIYEAVDREDLAESIEDRYESFRAFQGIDRTRPLGMMWSWDDETDPPATIFLPVVEIEELMKTASLGVVDYHKVTDNQYEIERPGAPYHVLVRSGYALFGESVPALHALRDAPDRITRDLREKYDVVFMLDQRQMPRDAKQAWIDDVRRQFEPWLQKQDNEPAESSSVRRALGLALLNAIERVLNDVQSVTVAARIDRATRQIQVDVTLEAEQGSTMAAELNRLIIQRSEFSALVNRDASAGLAINWPLMLLGKDLPGVDGSRPGGRLDFGIQLVGSDWSDMTMIAGIRGTEAAALNAALPHLLTRMAKSEDVTTLEQNVGKHRDVDLHRVALAKVPDFLQLVASSNLELLIGQSKQVVWIAAGPQPSLADRLKAAIDVVEDSSATERTGSVMTARMSLARWPEVLPVVNTDVTRDALQNSKDGFSLKVMPVRNGLKLQIIAESGLLRVIGQHWARQVDQNTVVR